MKISLSVLVMFLLFSFASIAQQRAYGLEYDRESFLKVPSFSTQGEKTVRQLPISADLSEYGPIAGNQGSLYSCGGWATAYGAFTIQYAAQHKIRDRNEIQRIALSAMFPYIQLRPNCDRGVQLQAIGEHIQNKGNLTFTDFGAVTCNKPIFGELLTRARQNRPIRAVVQLFNDTTLANSKRYFTKEQIARFNTPVIVGIQIDKAFENLSAAADYYRPNGEKLGKHAVTVVGYDAVSFKILNSYGPAWGKQGYFSILFSDFERIAINGEVLVLAQDYSHGAGPVTTARSTKIGGTFGFQYMDPTGIFKQVAPKHQGNGIYTLDRKNWEVDQQFQMLTKNTRQAQSMCVFSIDEANVVNIHWPVSVELSSLEYGMGTKPVTSYLPATDYDLVIPANDSQGRAQALSIEKAGTDYLCVLYSDKDIMGELGQILNAFKNARGDIYSRLQKALGSRLVPAANIQYEPNRMGAVANSLQGYVVPLVLKVESVN